jgi:hypothetical protein
MKISYAVTVADEIKEIQQLLPLLIQNKSNTDEIVVQYDNQKVTVESFGSTVSTPRSLVLGSSQFIVTGAYVNGSGSVRYPYQVANPGFSVNAGTSTIIFTNAYAGNSGFVPYSRMYPGDNTSYHNIEISSSSSFMGIYARNFSANNVSFAGGGFIGTDFGRYNKMF